MSTQTPTDGPGRAEEGDAAVRTVTNALDRLADGDRDRVTLGAIVRESGLTPAAAEAAMGSIERVATLDVKRVAERGPVAWDVSL